MQRPRHLTGFVLLASALAFIATSDPVLILAQEQQSNGSELIRYFLTVDGKEYSLRYLVEGARILSMNVNQETKSLVIILDSSHRDGKLQIGLQRDLIEAKDERNIDIEYNVFIDGTKVNYTELDKTAWERIVEIPFNSSAREIVITGTYLVPEFPAFLGPIVLASGLAGGILLMSRLQIRRQD